MIFFEKYHIFHFFLWSTFGEFNPDIGAPETTLTMFVEGFEVELDRFLAYTLPKDTLGLFKNKI